MRGDRGKEHARLRAAVHPGARIDAKERHMTIIEPIPVPPTPDTPDQQPNPVIPAPNPNPEPEPIIPDPNPNPEPAPIIPDPAGV
jgi:hypothetical protein